MSHSETPLEEHTCSDMVEAVADDNNATVYRPRYRMYGIRQGHWEEAVNYWDEKDRSIDLIRLQRIYYCPWCGEMLPGPLKDQWRDILENELGLDNISVFEHDDRIPPDMLTDVWWKIRGYGVTSEVLAADWGEREYFDGEVVSLSPDAPRPDPPVEGIVTCYEHAPPGFRHPAGKLPHCCDIVWDTLEDPRTLFSYFPWTREYGVRLVDITRPAGEQPLRIKPIRHCPWCGDALPPSLRDDWEKRVRARGFDPDTPCTPYPEGLPEDLASDRWWREAGL